MVIHTSQAWGLSIRSGGGTATIPCLKILTIFFFHCKSCYDVI